MSEEMTGEQYLDVETVMLSTAEGEQECAILDYFSFEDRKYAIVSPVVDDCISDSVEIFRYKENGENITFDIVSDKKLFNRIAQAYNNQ